MRRKIFPAFFVSLVALMVAPAAFAQTTGDGGPDPSQVRVRIGPLWMNPTISMPNIGIDTNVFNVPQDQVPTKDFTVSVLPKVDMWLRLGRTWLIGAIAEEVVWYQKSTTERSVNGTYNVGWKAPLNRLVLTTGATLLHTKSRPGFEIDARAQRTEPLYEGSVEFRGFAKTLIGVRGSWNQVRFAEGQIYNGVDLQEQLDRTITSGAITIRHELTPLTSITFAGGRSDQQFKTAPSRNSSSDDYSVGLTFDPAALIKGSAKLGYTIYKPEAADLAGYSGFTADAGLSYTLLGSTRISGTLTRNVQYSYDVNQPYYLLTGGTLSVGQQIFGPFDVVARLGAGRLHYETRTDVAVTDPNRIDQVRSFGAGFGFHLGQELRIGFNVDKDRRTSVDVNREYKGLRYGSSVTYGL